MIGKKYYDEVILRRLQLEELEILKDFISLCSDHKLTYFGIAGTAIGAIRHSGFIPWDDDIDVAMPREDYNKFVALAEKNLSDKYLVVDCERFPDYPLMTGRLVKRGTEFVEWNLRGLDFPNGIFFIFNIINEKNTFISFS